MTSFFGLRKMSTTRSKARKASNVEIIVLDDSSTNSSESSTPVAKKVKREPCFLLRLLNDTLSMMKTNYGWDTNQKKHSILQTLSGQLLELDAALKEETASVSDFWNVIGNSLIKKALNYRIDDLFELLLKYAVQDKEIELAIGGELIRLACSCHYVEHVKTLLDQGALIDSYKDESLLLFAYGVPELITILLEHGAPVNDRGDGPTGYWDTCLTAASRDGDLDLMNLLFKHGADPNSTCADMNPPIVLASFYGKLEAVQILLDHGADMNAVDTTQETSGGTALSNACAEGYVEIARLLLDRGADPTIPDKDGRVAIDLVEEGSEIAQLILNAQLEPILK